MPASGTICSSRWFGLCHRNAAYSPTIDSTGLFTAMDLGESFEVVATASGLSATGFVSVTSSSLNSLARAAIAGRPVLNSISATNGTVLITWSALAGVRYQLQAADALTSATWTPVGLGILADTDTVIATDPITSRARLYRVLVLP